MKVQNSITSKLTEEFDPVYLTVENESHQHSVPAASETHFKVYCVSKTFAGLSRVERQRKVYSLLAEELAGPVHALSLRLVSPEEWEQAGNKPAPPSPACRGGSNLS